MWLPMVCQLGRAHTHNLYEISAFFLSMSSFSIVFLIRQLASTEWLSKESLAAPCSIFLWLDLEIPVCVCFMLAKRQRQHCQLCFFWPGSWFWSMPYFLLIWRKEALSVGLLSSCCRWAPQPASPLSPDIFACYRTSQVIYIKEQCTNTVLNWVTVLCLLVQVRCDT